MILDEIIERKRLELDEKMKDISIEDLKQRFKRQGLNKAQDFYSAIKRKSGISIIAELKKASPSKGLIKPDFDPVVIAREYCSADIQALSVLTEKNFFSGNDDDIVKIRQHFSLPVLRKDFIIDLWQVYQSCCLGADAILLIASILSDHLLRKFKAVANILGMQCIVEVHDRKELERALESEAKIIGINNRNLKTFEVDLDTTAKLVNYIPNNRAIVSESGINTAKDFKYLESIGVDAVLIGEAFMRAESISAKVNEFRSSYAVSM